MFLRKKVPELYDLSIGEIKNVINRASYDDKLIEDIKQNLNIRVTFYNERGGKSDHCRLIELICQTIDKLSMKEVQIFKDNFLQRLTNYPKFVTGNINFVAIENRDIQYFTLAIPTYFKLNNYYVSAISYCYAGNKWYKIASPLQIKEVYNYEKIRNIIIILYSIMVINQLDLDDSKEMIKDCCFLVNNVSRTDSVSFL